MSSKRCIQPAYFTYLKAGQLSPSKSKVKMKKNNPSMPRAISFQPMTSTENGSVYLSSPNLKKQDQHSAYTHQYISQALNIVIKFRTLNAFLLQVLDTSHKQRTQTQTYRSMQHNFTSCSKHKYFVVSLVCSI